MIKIFCVVLFVGVVIGDEPAVSFANKKKFVEIIPDRVEVLHEIPGISETHIKVRKINKIRYVVGYIDVQTPIGNDFLTECKLLKKQGGEYRYLPYVLPPSPVCEFMKNDKYLYPDMSKSSDFPEDVASNCPLPIGNYSIYNYTLNTDKIVIAATHSGEYAAEVIFSRDGKQTAIYRAYGYINNV